MAFGRSFEADLAKASSPKSPRKSPGESMHTRLFGKTARNISEVGLGAWQLGADWGTPPSQEDAFAILQAALDQGVNLIDTADVYGAGRSEELIGRFLKAHPSDSIFVATKQGRSAGWQDSYEVMKDHATASLKRLGVEALDLLQLHCIPFSVLQRGDVFAHLDRLQQEGIIKHYGVSVESVEEALYCITQHPGIAALQVIFNIFRQKLVDELLPIAQEHNVGLLARVPLASGLLAKRWDAQHTFHPEDHRHFNADGQCFNVGETFAGIPFSDGISLAAKAFACIPELPSATPAQRALRWVLDHPAISSVIPGASNPQQATQNAQASALSPLSPETHNALKSLYQNEISPSIRGPY